MKKFFALSLLVLSMIFFVSCGSDSKKEDKEGNQTDSEQNDDSDAGDSGSSGDSGDSGDSGSSGNSGDSGDSGSSGNSGDSGDSGNSGDSGSDTADDFTVDENIFEVPADQDNTVGAPCDKKTFVEFCDGNAYVECSAESVGYDEIAEEEIIEYIVQKYECSEEYPTCLTYRKNDEGWEHNWAVCLSTCEKAGKTSECSSIDDGYYFWYSESICKQTSKGLFRFTGEERPCNSGCSEDGKTCEIKKCDPKKDKTYCDENNVLHECSDYEEEVYYQAVYFCGALKGRICGYDEEFEEFGCFPDPYFVDEDLVEVPKNQDNTKGKPCDPDTFIEFCDGNIYVHCESTEFEQDWFVSRTECDGPTPVCFTFAYDEGDEKRYNNADCYSSCKNENVGTDTICRTTDSGFTFDLEKYRCIETSKGKLRFTNEIISCNSACSEDGKTCEIKECDPEKEEAYCDKNGVLHKCIWGEDLMETANFCAVEGKVCRYDEHYGENNCFLPDDGNDEGEND